MSQLSRRSFLGGSLVIAGGSILIGLDPRVMSRAGAVAPLAGPVITDCAGWGAAPPTSPIVVLNQRPTKIIVHHTAGANSADLSQEHAFQVARDIQQGHFARGWIDSGQQFTISRGGFVMEGRHESKAALEGGTQQVQGAQTEGQNDVSVGIENEGTYTDVQILPAHYAVLVDLCVLMCQNYGITASSIYGHRDYNNTECPGAMLYPVLPTLRSDVAARIGQARPLWVRADVGSRGDRATTVQYLLVSRGQQVAVDGAFGPGTEAAVKAFQTSVGVPADGVVGASTWTALIQTVRAGDTGPAVQAVQAQLSARVQPMTVDGTFSADTEANVRSLQSASGLTVDGIVAPQTWDALVS